MLAVHLWELAPDHAIFEEPAFSNKALDDLVFLGSQKSQKMHGLYKETRNNSIQLQVCISEIEQSAWWLFKFQVPPRRIVEAPSPLPP
jgi:hypothetical protein